MPINYTSNNSLLNTGLNITPIYSPLYSNDYFNVNNSYGLNLNGSSSSLDTYEPQFTLTSTGTGTYSPISGYGLINAAAAVAQAAGQNTFADVPNLGGNNWGADLVKAPEAWAKGYTGQGVVVAVLDTGVDYNHADLKDNIWTNPNNDAAQGYANDVHGWNFVDNNNNVLDTSEIGHGTHVAGIIAGENNGFGLTGVAYNAKIMPVKVLDDSGTGSYTSIINGIYYAVNHGANVINLSLGGGSGDSSLASALQYASNKGVVVVMAAGNGSATSPAYPAKYATNWGLAVGAVDQKKNIASFSNYAGYNPLAYVTAPGVNIYSTIPGNKYITYSGTSMATPYVAGVVALMLSANHNLSESQVRQIVTQTADKSAQSTTSSLTAPSTINTMMTSHSLSIRPVVKNTSEISGLGFRSTINSMTTSSTVDNNDILLTSNIRSQFVSYYDNSIDDNSNYSISSDDDTDIENCTILHHYRVFV